MSATLYRQGGLALVALATLLFAMVFGPGTALAQNPQFIRANITLDNNGNLVCSWKEAGLGNNQRIDYVCGADVVYAFYQCVNKGGGTPQPHTATQEDPEARGTFDSGKNGQITASLTAEVPTPPSSFCPNTKTWTLRLEGVRWCGAFLEDTTNMIVGATAPELSFRSTSNLPPC